jgi:hypothetical protein
MAQTGRFLLVTAICTRARRDTRREPIIERTEHPDLFWVRRSRSNVATIWICRRGPDIGNIIEAIGITTPPENYYGIRCSDDAVAILQLIRWRDALDPLPVGHTPNMSQSDIVRAYEAAKIEQPDDADDDHATAFPDSAESTPRALATEFVAKPHGSSDLIWPRVRYGLDVLPNQPANSVIPLISPPFGEAGQSTDGDVPQRASETVPAAANMGLWNGNIDSIVEWLMADPDNAAAVWRALGARLASSMSVLLLAWHGIPIPDNPLLFPARPPG